MSNRSHLFRDKAHVAEHKYDTVLSSLVKHGGLTYDEDATEGNKAWLHDFQHDLVIGKIYEHEYYDKCRLERVIVSPSVEFKRHWLFWHKVRPIFTLKVVISFQLDKLPAAGVISLEEFILGIKESNNFVSKFKKMLNKLQND